MTPAQKGKLLVTGSTGQIGSYVVEEAKHRGWLVNGLDLRPDAHTTHVGDIRRPEDVRAAMQGCDAVIHCAAQISVQGSIEDPVGDASHNITGTITLLESARRIDIKRFVNVSSAAVYGNPQALPIAESHPTLPLSPYGASKLAAEGYARMFHLLHGLETVTVRPFNVYSVRQDPSNPYSGVMSKFAARTRNRESPIVFGDGAQTRDFIHAQDVASALLEAASLASPIPAGATINLGSGREVSVADLAALFIKASGHLGLKTVHAPPRSGEIQRSIADVTLARKYGLTSQIPLERGIQTLMAPQPAVEKPTLGL
ncbi:MAG TPA: NAD-dependent epimerase/dehydratase family protein [Candidatus Thermoplasmatota archaeon]|nr:NAD-dependent epimerase/dehydratase family protein [Candidatus Thermoplasmatota archaeon]